MTEPVLTDLFETIVGLVSTQKFTALQTADSNITGVSFEYGRKFDITQVIKQNDESPSYATKASTMPMVWLYVPYREKPSKIDGCPFNVSLNIAIICNTKPEYTMRERDQYTFGPILEPICAELFRQIDRSGYFHIYDIGQVPRQKFRRPMWGTEANKNELIMPVDAIEISGLELDVYYQDECSQS